MNNTSESLFQSNQITEILCFLGISYSFSWLFWTPGVLASYGIIPNIPWPPLFAIGVCGPLIAAVICLYKEGRWPAVRNWFKNGFSPTVKSGWWFFIILIPFIVPALGLGLYRILDGEMLPLQIVQQPWIVLSSILLMVTIGGGQEEYGWRGYLLPRLDSMMPAWKTDLLMIPIHACWHLPLFIITYTIQSQYPFWLFLIFGFGLTPLLNRVFRSTSGNFIAAILFHGLTNAGFDVFPPVTKYVNHSFLPLMIISCLMIIVQILFHISGKNRDDCNLPNTVEITQGMKS